MQDIKELDDKDISETEISEVEKISQNSEGESTEIENSATANKENLINVLSSALASSLKQSLKKINEKNNFNLMMPQIKKYFSQEDKSKNDADTDLNLDKDDDLTPNFDEEPEDIAPLKLKFPKLNELKKIDLDRFFLKRTRNYTTQEHLEQFKPVDSFVDRLPWVEFLEQEQCILLEDGRSVGAVFEITVKGTEGRSIEYLEEVRTQVTWAIQDSFVELDNNPWVVQFYCQDDDSMPLEYEKVLRDYVQPRAKGSEFTEEWLKVMTRHLYSVSKAGGLFEDKAVTGTPWRGQSRTTRMVLYRYVEESMSLEDSIEDLNSTAESLLNSLNGAGIKAKRLLGANIHDWLLRWFNPNPWGFEDNKDLFYTTAGHTVQSNNTNDLYLSNDFAETLFVNAVRSENNFWYFDDQPHTCVIVDSLRRPPVVGHITGEVPRGDNVNALFDIMPEGTIMCLTVVVYPQDQLENHLAEIRKGAIGDNTDSIYARQAVDDVQAYLNAKHKLYQSSLCFYLRANDERTLLKNKRKLITTLQGSGLVPIRDSGEIAPYSNYIRWLPMSFNPALDKKRLYTKFNFVQHIANLMPVFGRTIGTRHPGITYFNRGGSPLDFDPINSEDRAKTAHMLLLGPTGAGKSATLNGKIAQLMAMHKPRLFVIEAGNSFGLMADYCKRLGLTVNAIQLKPGAGVSLPLFADAHKILENKEQLNAEKEKENAHLSDDTNLATAERKEINNDTDAFEGDSQRDILGEMEIIARLMITGGKESEDERMTRSDEAMIRKAIVLAAENTYREGKVCLTEDVAKAFHQLSRDESLPQGRRERAYEMGDAIGIFCQPGSFDAELFNSEGTHWKDVDFTLVDLATLAREGYEVQLSIAYISLINHINSLGEKTQHEGRPIVNITDEAHIITVNPMLARFLAKGGKMWRKLGIWLWLATQNMKDFPNDAAKLLSMLEWWELLCLEKDEVEQITRFKQLSPAQQAMLQSTKKEKRKYTEGVVLSSNLEALFRVVPPSLYLALAMTESEEKAERMELMKQHSITELDAAMMVADKIDKARGIT